MEKAKNLELHGELQGEGNANVKVAANQLYPHRSFSYRSPPEVSQGSKWEWPLAAHLLLLPLLTQIRCQVSERREPRREEEVLGDTRVHRTS